MDLKSKIFGHENGQNFCCQLTKIWTLTMAKIQIFFGQNFPKKLTKKFPFWPKAKSIEYDLGQSWGHDQNDHLSFDHNHVGKKLEGVINHGANSRMSVAMVRFFDQ